MKLYLIHHAHPLTKEQDPGRHLSQKGRDECELLAARFKAAGVAPARILHSDKQWTLETAERIAAAMGLAENTALAGYPINTGHPIAPFIKEIEDADGDIMMTGHSDYLVRTASKLLCGDEDCRIIEFKPGNCTTFCLERNAEGDWAIIFAWRLEHLAP